MGTGKAVGELASADEAGHSSKGFKVLCRVVIGNGFSMAQFTRLRKVKVVSKA
jgi:hypothetical protein